MNIDITYVRLAQRSIYLAVVLDVFTRSLRGWRLGRYLDSDLALNALQMALTKGQPDIHHSDQDVQYAATGYVTRLQVAGVFGLRGVRRGCNCHESKTRDRGRTPIIKEKQRELHGAHGTPLMAFETALIIVLAPAGPASGSKGPFARPETPLIYNLTLS